MKAIAKNQLFVLLLFTSVFVSAQTYKYPLTPVRPVTDEYFGTQVTDNYRWLEDLSNPEVQSWLKDQAELANSVMDQIPNRQKILAELKANHNSVSTQYFPIGRTAGKYFYGKQLSEEQTQKIYYRTGLTGKEVLLFDPQRYIAGKTFEFTARVSVNGTKLILSLYESGAELGDIRVLDVKTGKFLPDIIPHSRPVSFAGESSTDLIYYEYKNYDSHNPENRLNVAAKLHVLGTPVESDIVLASSNKNPDLLQPSDLPSVMLVKDCPYIFLSKVSTERDRTRYYASRADLKKPQINWRPLTVKEDEVKDLFVRGRDIYFFTSKGNPHFRLIKANLEDLNIKNAETIFEGDKEWKLVYAALTKDYLVFTKTKNDLIARSFTYELKTRKLKDINVPLKGNIYIDTLSEDVNDIVLVSNGWNSPESVHSYDLKARKLFHGIYDSANVFPDIENIVFEEVEVPSHDGVLVPLTLVYDKKLVKKDGSSTALMDGYGAYGRTPLVPGFRSDTLPLLKRGVVLAYAHVRGGGEKGNDWYLGGKKGTKPNTWKDLNACAEYLIENKYTSPEKLGIIGSSAGGITIGRAITERPDLYKVAIARVGLLNMLRMEFSPNGPANIPEFGTVTIEQEFKALLEMDAMHHVRQGVKYPAQLITAGINDRRVASYIPAKFAAAMQANNISGGPVLLDINYKGGHFGGVSQDEQFEQTAREYAFLLWQTGDPEFQSRH